MVKKIEKVFERTLWEQIWKSDRSEKFWVSKRFWMNVFFIVGGILTALSESVAIGTPITAIGVINLALLYHSKAPLEWDF